MRPLTFVLLCSLGASAAAVRADDAAEVPAEVQQAVTAMASEDRETRQHAAEAALDLQHPLLLAPLTKLVKDEYRSVREPAIQALAAREAKEERVKSARTLEARLKELDRRPDSPEELAVLVQALHDLAQPTSLELLIDGVEDTTENDVALARLRAAANVPTKEAVEKLIAFAARGRRGDTHRGAALRALEYATGVKLSNLDAWHRWWADNRRAYDPEVAAAQRARSREESDAKRKEREERRAKRAEREAPGKPPEAPPEKPPEKPPEDAPGNADEVSWSAPAR